MRLLPITLVASALGWTVDVRDYLPKSIVSREKRATLDPGYDLLADGVCQCTTEPPPTKPRHVLFVIDSSTCVDEYLPFVQEAIEDVVLRIDSNGGNRGNYKYSFVIFSNDVKYVTTRGMLSISESQNRRVVYTAEEIISGNSLTIKDQIGYLGNGVNMVAALSHAKKHYTQHSNSEEQPAVIIISNGRYSDDINKISVHRSERQEFIASYDTWFVSLTHCSPEAQSDPNRDCPNRAAIQDFTNMRRAVEFYIYPVDMSGQRLTELALEVIQESDLITSDQAECREVVYDCKCEVDEPVCDDDGAAGPQGQQGPRGEKGAPGIEGRQGSDGEPGLDGPDGEKGEKGAKGQPGVDGEDGKDGRPGRPGAPGDKGERGEVGEPGEDGQGIPGARGDKGQRGEPGQPGRPGERGERGPQGPKGERGDDGEPGERGRDGQPGRPGLPGSPGRDCVGEPGRPGPKGPQGLAGLPGLPGRDGVPGADGKHGQCGPPGQKGEPGHQGPPGDDGETGPKGRRGQDGADGKPGPQGPQGAQGPPGIDGEPGEPGEPGPQGSTIHGRDGLQGPPGHPGKPGKDGEPGDDGCTGSTGEPGLPGPRGKSGKDGVDGPKGQKGEPGIPGLRGPPGRKGPNKNPDMDMLKRLVLDIGQRLLNTHQNSQKNSWQQLDN